MWEQSADRNRGKMAFSSGSRMEQQSHFSRVSRRIAYLVIAFAFGPIWCGALSLPISPVSSSLLPSGYRGMFGCESAIFSISSTIAAIGLMSIIGACRTSVRFIVEALIFSVFVAVSYSLCLIVYCRVAHVPPFNEQPYPPLLPEAAYLVVYAVLVCALSIHVALPISLCEVWCLRKALGPDRGPKPGAKNKGGGDAIESSKSHFI